MSLGELIKKYRKAVMGIAALWIVAFHVSFPVFQDMGLLTKVETAIKRIGFCGVDIFLFVSGIGLVYAIQKSSLSTFYRRRIQRVIVPFVLMGILEMIVEKWSFDKFLRLISGYSFYFEYVYSFLWFVPLIITIYAVFPLYFFLFRRASNKRLFTVGVIVLWLVLSLCLRDIMRPDFWGFTNRIPVFVVGVLVGWQSQVPQTVPRRIIWIALIFALILGVLLAYLTNYRNVYVLVPSSNCCVPTFLLAVSLSFLIPKGIDMLFSMKKMGYIGKGLLHFLEFYGTISIELYCIQEYLVSKFLYPFFKVFLANVAYNIPLNMAILGTLSLVAMGIHKATARSNAYNKKKIERD